MTDAQKGIAAALGANLIWGLSPLFWKHIAHVPPLEVFSHRTLWSAVLFGLLLAFQGRFRVPLALLFSRKNWLAVVGAAFMVSINWSLYIYAVQINRVVEGSLGYFIFPLVAVMLGYLVYRERLSPGKWLAVGLAATGVVVLTLGLGVAPWISLTLAFSFGLYGLIKKSLDAGPVVSVTAEVMVIAPFSLIWLAGVTLDGWTDFSGRSGGYFGHSVSDSVFLIISGLVTALPLILFSYASRRVSYATVGLMQYSNPTMQFLLAAFVFGEAITQTHIFAFSLIWGALLVYSWSSFRGR